jgi:hypothetical protein
MISISKGVESANPTKSATKRVASHDMRSFTSNLPSSWNSDDIGPTQIV